MLIFPLIVKIQRHVTYQKIALCTKFLVYLPYNPAEGSVSQNLDLGPD